MLEIKTAEELITPELEAEWAARRSARRSPILQHVLRAFLTVGGPVSLEAVEAALPGYTRDALREHLTALDAQDLIQLGAEGVEIAYPFSATPTSFVVHLADGRERYACCAVDALGMAPMIQERIEIRSRCHHCGDPLALTVEPENPAPGARRDHGLDRDAGVGRLPAGHRALNDPQLLPVGRAPAHVANREPGRARVRDPARRGVHPRPAPVRRPPPRSVSMVNRQITVYWSST